MLSSSAARGMSSLVGSTPVSYLFITGLVPHRSHFRPKRCRRKPPCRLITSVSRSSMAKERPQLGPVEKTLLMTLFARAEETKKEDGVLSDPKAVEIVETLDYDFSPWENSGALPSVNIRTIMMDQDVNQFLEKYPNGTVVEIGCGLNTRFERVDNGSVRWFDIDLPDTIALRRKYFKDDARRTMIATDVLDKEWMDVVKQTGGPWCFVSEGAIIFLDNAQARQTVTQIAEKFPGCWLSMDTVSQRMVDSQASNPLMNRFDEDSWFRWACNDPEVITEWTGLILEKKRSVLDVPREFQSKLPFPYNILVRVVPFLLRWFGGHYYINLFIGKSGGQE